jgi:hypothetical protein
MIKIRNIPINNNPAVTLVPMITFSETEKVMHDDNACYSGYYFWEMYLNLRSRKVTIIIIILRDIYAKQLFHIHHVTYVYRSLRLPQILRDIHNCILHMNFYIWHT